MLRSILYFDLTSFCLLHMKDKTMFRASKGLYATLICLASFSFSTAPVHAQDGLPTPPQDMPSPPTQQDKKDDGKSMKTLRWNTQNKKEEPAIEEKATAEATELDTSTDKTAESSEIPEEEMTAEQKMWKKYTELVEAGKNKKNTKDRPETYSESEAAESNLTNDAVEEGDAEKIEEQATGMQAVLDRYKNSQKNKGVMNSRSFGSVD